MKAQQAKTLAVISEALDAQHAALEEIAGEVRDTFDELSERAQEGERGQRLEEEADELETAAEELENVIGTLQGLCGA